MHPSTQLAPAARGPELHVVRDLQPLQRQDGSACVDVTIWLHWQGNVTAVSLYRHMTERGVKGVAAVLAGVGLGC